MFVFLRLQPKCLHEIFEAFQMSTSDMLTRQGSYFHCTAACSFSYIDVFLFCMKSPNVVRLQEEMVEKKIENWGCGIGNVTVVSFSFP